MLQQVKMHAVVRMKNGVTLPKRKNSIDGDYCVRIEQIETEKVKGSLMT